MERYSRQILFEGIGEEGQRRLRESRVLVVGYGVTLTVRPRVTPCLRCVFPQIPAAASAPTCDTAGVIMPIISVVAAVQVAEALKLLAGRSESLHGGLLQFDVWRNVWRRV